MTRRRRILDEAVREPAVHHGLLHERGRTPRVLDLDGPGVSRAFDEVAQHSGVRFQRGSDSPDETLLVAEVREAVAGDAEAVEAVWAQVAAEGEWIGTELPLQPGWGDRFRAALAARESSWSVAEVDGYVVGGVFVHEEHGLAHLGMAILEGYRGVGLGGTLLTAAVDWARNRGCHKVTLEVWPHNARARRLYQSAGFVEEGHLERHYRRRNGALWDAVVMALILDLDSPGRP